jgi:hypothetical protein
MHPGSVADAAVCLATVRCLAHEQMCQQALRTMQMAQHKLTMYRDTPHHAFAHCCWVHAGRRGPDAIP